MFVSFIEPVADHMETSAGEGAASESADRPTILVLGAGAQAIYLSNMAERAGLHCLGTYTPQAAQSSFGWSCSADHILLDMRGGAMQGEIDAAASWAAGSRMTVLVDLDGLDHALAVLDGPGVDYLCDPAASEIVTLLVMASLAKPGSRHQLHDVTRDGEVARLEQLSQDVQRLAVTIEQMSVGFGRGLPGSAEGADRPKTSRIVPRTEQGLSLRSLRSGNAHTDASADDAPTHAEIRALIRARRMRDQFFPTDLFADPAWDMMLDLMAARLAGQRVSVSSLCIAAAVPPTTALRWIRQLTDRAMFMRIDDPLDGRRVFIDLTETATQALFGWVRAVRRNGGLLATA